MAVESRPPASTGAGTRSSPGPRPLPGHVRPDGWRPAALEWAGLAAVAVAALAADQLTKTAVDRSLALGGMVHLAPGLSLWHVQNQGVAFGAFSGRLPVVVLLTAAAVSWMVVYFARSGARHPLLPVAIGLLLGGSVSNLLGPHRPRLRDGLRLHPPLAHVQPRRQLHRRRCGAPSLGPAAR